MTEDWAAVARAINQRTTELGLSQRELIARSQVSKATVGELQRNSVQRRRGTRTLEALSLALGWHPDHLLAVLTGRRVPAVGEPMSHSDDDIAGRLAAIEYRLAEIAAQVGSIGEVNSRLDDIQAALKSVGAQMSAARNSADD
ncbi:MAG TPA: transcriptional regulator [Pseudonocardiaceae bacterium]|nr:transcriptional regulator [Pseudonocardiaceae bacterium]